MANKLTQSSTASASSSNGSSQSQSQSQSATQKVLDTRMLQAILAGLAGGMTDEEIRQYAENLLLPQKNAQMEASRQQYETTRLSKEQEIESLAAELERSIVAQSSAYRQNAAQVETEALKRGMGRSSYTMQTLANQGTLLAQAIRELTEENERKTGQLQAQISQAAAQNAQTQGRLEADYAANLAAKADELRRAQSQQYNQNYLTAVSSSMGSATSGAQMTSGTTSGTTSSAGSSTSYSGDAPAPAQSDGRSSASSGGSGTSRSSGTSKSSASKEEEESETTAKAPLGRYNTKRIDMVR